jgi:Uma2 family endonuclease
MGLPKEQTGGFTYADYLTWPEDERWELIDGVAWNMSSVPCKLTARSHQRILGKLYRLIADITDSGPCETYLAPFDVRLREDSADKTITADETITTVVQPDISVFCSPDVLDEAGARGAPDMVVEILSPSTSYKDQTHKLALYERHGVREYWIVNGEARWVMVYRMGSDNRYGKPDYYRAGQEGEVIASTVLGGAGIPVNSFL